jgi:Uncharacterized conserved protein (COG2071)
MPMSSRAANEMPPMLRRQPLPVATRARHSLVLVYAWPREVLAPLIPSELEADLYDDVGLVAVALVEAEDLRPRGYPRALGRDGVLAGYRIFVRWRDAGARDRRGLLPLRTDTDAPAVVRYGRPLARPRYDRAEISLEQRPEAIEIEIRTRRRDGDLHVIADLTSRPAPLPPGSPFRSLSDARDFAGPLPLTETESSASGGMVEVLGMPTVWNPQPIAVDVRELAFFQGPPFGAHEPVLANAVYACDVEFAQERAAAATRRAARSAGRRSRRWQPRPGQLPQPS